MAKSEVDKVGIIGLGIIGNGVAGVLRKENQEVYVWNRSPKPEPNFLGSPGELARIANIIQIFVTDGEALLGVLDQMKDKLTSNHVILNHSTVELQATVAAYKLVKEAGAKFLDAPFTGSKDAAANGALVYYVGGEADVLERVRPILELSAKEVVPIGRVGEATLIKIATNMISAATVGVLSEAYGLVSAAGLNPDVLQNAIEHNACGSVLTSMKLPSIIAKDYEPHFSLKNMFKDSKFALELARDYGLEMPVLSTTANVMFRAMQKGHSEKDYSALAIAFQQPPSSGE